MANLQLRAERSRARLFLRPEAVLGDFIDKKRQQRRRQVMAHAGNDPQSGAGNVSGGVFARRRRYERILCAVQDQSRRANAPEHRPPISRRLNGEELSSEPLRVIAAAD